MSRRQRAGASAALLGALLGAILGGPVTAPAALPVASGAPTATETVEPPGTTTIVPQAAWSWFGDERATFTAGGRVLATSAVAGTSSTIVAPGTVVVAQLDLVTGQRQLVNLGRGEADDHNSASIREDPSGELTTAWSRHHRDGLVRIQRQRTDGSWLRLPPVDVGVRVTYNNLRESADAAGQPILYDFFRGARFDPSVLASADAGRTWADLGRVLRDPWDRVDFRPYVQYSPTRDGRIDLIATPTHPRESQTSLYHGYIEAGLVHSSTGAVLGPLGTAIPVTALTAVWEPSNATDRAWTTDVVIDPITGAPTVVFSVRISATDHRYWYGRWSGTQWETEEIAPAGRALYEREDDYTGLISIDPTDASRIVMSSDTSPVTGLPLTSTADGQRHWELWDGHRSAGGTWSWTALTSDSAEDNIRPILTSDPSGASALLWLRGTYTAYDRYDVDVVGAVRRPGGALVPPGPIALEPVTDVLPRASPQAARARPVVGSFDGHRADDLLLVRSGAGLDELFLGDDQRHPTPIATRSVISTAVPVGGDYDGNGRTDVYWYLPGASVDSLWTTTGVASFAATRPRQVMGTYTPIPGDFDGDGRTDIFWYAPGAAADSLWRSTAGGFVPTASPQVAGTYTPVPGDYDGDGRTDIFWRGAGGSGTSIWFGGTAGGFTIKTSGALPSAFTPIPGDYDGDGRTDLFWYAPGARVESLWFGAPDRTFRATTPRPVFGTYTPIPGDFDGDGADDIHWYATGSATDQLWWSADGPLASISVAPVNL